MSDSELNTEQWRAKEIKDKLSLDLMKFATDVYPAVAIHYDSTMIDANQTCADYFGYSVDEINGMNAWLFFSEKSVLVIMDKLVNKSEEPYQVIAVKKDGTEFNVELKGLEMEVSGLSLRMVQIRLV